MKGGSNWAPQKKLPSKKPSLIMVKEKSYCWNRCCLWLPLAHQEICYNKSKTLLSSPHVNLTQCVELLSKYLAANFKHLFEMELATNGMLLAASSVDNDLFIYVFTTSVGCEIISVGTTEL